MTLTDAELLQKVKDALGIVGDHLNSTLQIFIDDTKYYMRDAGVQEEVLNSAASAGAICRGVADLWNYGSGNADFSAYFMQRVTQLALKGGETGE